MSQARENLTFGTKFDSGGSNVTTYRLQRSSVLRRLLVIAVIAISWYYFGQTLEATNSWPVPLRAVAQAIGVLAMIGGAVLFYRFAAGARRVAVCRSCGVDTDMAFPVCRSCGRVKR